MDNAKITISRPYGGDSRYIRIAVRDDDACIEFLELKISLENFSEALTGLGNTECEMVTRGLENVGKLREQDTLVFPMPESDYSNRKEVAAFVAQKQAPEGWTADSYFDSQDSFQTINDVEMAKTQILRWVDKP